MKTIKFTIVYILFCIPLLSLCQDTIINLPKPITNGGKPLMEALKDRKSTRSYIDSSLSLQQLSNLLWAANGINRIDNEKRTAPSAVNWQEIDIYVFLNTGTYLWKHKTNTLKLICYGDNRKIAGKQGFVKDAAVNFVFISDYSRMKYAEESKKEFYSATDTGFISQNIYLYCASEGLGTVVLGMLDRDEITKFLKLETHQKVILSQCVGFVK